MIPAPRIFLSDETIKFGGEISGLAAKIAKHSFLQVSKAELCVGNRTDCWSTSAVALVDNLVLRKILYDGIGFFEGETP